MHSKFIKQNFFIQVDEINDVNPMTDYINPSLHLGAFNCPHCNAYAVQYWMPLYSPINSSGNTTYSNSFVSNCSRCKDTTIWINNNMVYPSGGSAPPPNHDMPDNIKRDYNEARDICLRSPRSACILLRLCVENICKEKEAKGNSLDEMIGYMVRENELDKVIQKALDSVRVIGGQAAHPLRMDLRDDIDIANKLFIIVNYISEWAYTRPKEVHDMFDRLPENKKSAVVKRDSK